MTALPEATPQLAPWATAGAILLLLILSALLSGAEAALATVSRGRLHGLADRGQPGAAAALTLTEDRERLAGAIRLGSHLANILAAVLATMLLTGLLGVGGVAVAAVVMTLLVLVFADMLPKAWAVASPEAAATRLARPLAAFVAVVHPLARLVLALVRHLLRLCGVVVDADASSLAAQLEIAGAIAPHPSDGAAEAEDRDRLLGALDLGERQVEAVMMPRREIEMIDAEAPPAAILDQAITSPHTRLPVFRGEPENIVGVIHAKDLMREVHHFARAHGGTVALDGFDVMDAAMPAYFVPETTPLDEQLREFLRRRSHFALVVDEYGALQGLVTLEDILEEIVGDIADEHDIDAPSGIAWADDGSVEVEGGVPIRDLNRACGWDLPDAEANTVAGLVIHVAQSIPSDGQAFSVHGIRFEVVERAGNRLTRLRARPLA